MNICPTFSNTVAVRLQSCKFSSKKIRPTDSSYQIKNSLNNSKNINQNFLSKIRAKLYSCNSSQKKNRAMFSSYQVKMFGDCQPNFWAKWEQDNEFVFFPRKKSITVFSSSGLKQFAKNQHFFRALFELIF